MRVDAHQHFWKLSRGDYSWLTPTPNFEKIYRDFLPEQLVPLLQEHNIDKTILVQAAATVEETEYMLQLYEEHDFIAGVVGWLDLEADSFPELFKEYQSREGFIGIRPMLQDIEDERWILRDDVLKNVELLVEDDFPLDILINPKHLDSIIELFKIFPQLRGVVDHLAKPYIKDRIISPWDEKIAEIASNKNVWCKLSGLITEDDHYDWKVENFKPYVNHCIEVFGKEKIMFGSDWPVCLLAGSYNDVYKSLLENISFTKDELDDLFGNNALKFYKLSK
ncbi:amidohydrolase family protein [Virgibacillus sp. W0430]|uniref:amidohydrolase family protein n=1 Tax=Virgibacillus sp. W0430 TaxID=3391580 RepID=UPI003F45D9A6